MSIWTNTFCNSASVLAVIVQREDVHNTSLIPGPDKYIFQIRHTFQNLDKYVLKIGPTHFAIRSLYQPSWFKERTFIILLSYQVETNTFFNFDIHWQFGQICFEIWTNIFCNLASISAIMVQREKIHNTSLILC